MPIIRSLSGKLKLRFILSVFLAKYHFKNSFFTFDLSPSFVVHVVVSILPTLLTTSSTDSRLLVVGVVVDNLHHDVLLFILRIDPVVVVDVVLEGVAENPPL